MKFINPMEDMLGYHLKRASSMTISQLCEGYSKLGLRLTEASILIMIEANPGLKQSEVGKVLDIKSANMAPLIAGLDQRNLIARKKLDGRSQGLFLTDEGKDMLVKVWQCVDLNEEWIKGQLNGTDLGSFTDSLDRLWR